MNLFKLWFLDNGLEYSVIVKARDIGQAISRGRELAKSHKTKLIKIDQVYSFIQKRGEVNHGNTRGSISR